MRISHKSLQQISTEFYKIAIWSFFITLIASTVGALAKGEVMKLMISLVSGQLAITLMKFCFYVSLIVLAASFVLRKIRIIHQWLHLPGDVLAGIGFASAAVAAGVGAGLFGGLLVETHLAYAFFSAFYLFTLFTSMCAVFWFAAAAPQLDKSKFFTFEGVAFTLLALVTAVASATFLYCEQWNEIDDLNREREIAICSCMTNR